MRQQLQLARQLHTEPDIAVNGGFCYRIALMFANQLPQFGDNIVKFFRIRQYRLRVTLLERVSDGEQRLLRHLLRLLQRAGVNHHKMAGA